MERRSFLAAMAGAAAAVVASGSSAWGKVKKPANSIAKVTALKVRQPVVVKTSYKGTPRTVIVHRYASSKYLVLDMTCTHQGCQIQLVDAATAQCPCHMAQFNLQTGENSVAPSGSATVAPLKRYGAVVKNGYLVFTT